MSTNSIDSDVFYVQQSSNDQSLARPNTPTVLNSTEMSGSDTREMISISSIASPEPQIVTIDPDSNEPTMPWGFGQQFPIIPVSLNHLNLLPNPFHILATMVVVNPAEDGFDENYSPQSSESSEPSPILTPRLNISTIGGCETPHTTTDDNTLYSDDEPRTIYFLPSIPYPPPPHRMPKRKYSLGMPFPKREGVSHNVSEPCGQMLPELKDMPGSSSTTNKKLKVEKFFLNI